MMLNDRFAVTATATNVDCLAKAQALAAQLNLQLVTEDNRQYAYLLSYTPARLELRATKIKNAKPIYVDFLAGKLHYRAQHLSWRRELLAKAVGIKEGYRPTILDATAGFGNDGFILAALGCDVTMVERSPIVWALLQDGLERLQRHLGQNSLKIKLVFLQAIDFINNFFCMVQEEAVLQPDVIYLDPMYPERVKSALGKQNMRLLHEIVGEDQDADKLLAAALKVARKRVVVKRPKLAPHLGNRKPNLVFTGKSSRFDVYIE